MKIINMPSFGADMAVGKITEWKVNEGDTVARGDIIATIETMKGLIDMEVFDNGTITTLLVKQGEQVLTILMQQRISTQSMNTQKKQTR
jgi:pyruvate dehydrogenase E2 component (dihydrolipoamide acetyltransferase)